jgi:hypothetical protein
VELTLPGGSLREKFEAVSTACAYYRTRLMRSQDPPEMAAETAARDALDAATSAIQARYSGIKDD